MIIKHTFDFGAYEVDLFRVGGHHPEEPNPVAVSDPPSVHLSDLIVTAEPVPDLEHARRMYTLLQLEKHLNYEKAWLTLSEMKLY